MRIISARLGFTLLEVALGLVITGLVLGGLWVVSADVLTKENTNQLEKGILNTATRIRNFYQDRQIKNDNANLNNANLLALNLIAPEILSNQPGGIAHNLNVPGAPGTITINYDGAKCVVVNSFAMTLQNLTQDACNKIVPGLVGTRGQIQSNNVVGLYIGNNTNTNVLLATTTNGVTSYNFNPTTAQTNCKNGANIEICFGQ